MIEVLVFGLSSNKGGIETYLLKIWRNIDHNRFHFSFINMCGKNKKPCFYDELIKDGCIFYDVTPRRESIYKNIIDIQNLFKENHFDILHFNVNTLSYISPVLIALHNKCSVVVHSRSSNAEFNSISGYLHHINKVRLSRLNVKRIAVSEEAGKWLFGESSFDVFHNGVEIERFRFNVENRNIIRSEITDNNPFVIGHVGAFLPVKNHLFMLDVFEAYTKSNKNTELWFVGDGPLKEKINEEVKRRGLGNCVKLLGSRSDMGALYAGMDMLWLPSQFEGYPNVVIEAQCSGLPCLVSDKVPEEVLLADNCIQFSLGQSIESWCKKINEVNRQTNRNRSLAYIQMIEKGVSVEKEIRRIEHLYETVVR